MLDYRLVEAFAAVIEEGGFDKAARRLHITQSAVSQRIKQLEEQHGQVLLQRTNPPRPTETGIGLFRHYHQVQHLEQDLSNGKTATPRSAYATLALAINADSLATWFFQAVQSFLREQKVVLDLHIDDQDQTHKLLQEGKVLGCITTRDSPLQGCRITPLGIMEYGLCCSPSFARTWFPQGFDLAAVEQAPVIRFNRQDGLNEQLFDRIFPGFPQDVPTFFVPSSEMFVTFIKEGLCYGILPEQQSRSLLESGELIDLLPGYGVKVELYWHCWNLRSELLESFSKRFIDEVRRMLKSTGADDNRGKRSIGYGGQEPIF
jgi:LysR family transcriptional regulator (chromosome initiation inhibitor)